MPKLSLFINYHGRPQLRYRDIGKRGMKELSIYKNKRRLRKEKLYTANLIVTNTVKNGLDP